MKTDEKTHHQHQKQAGPQVPLAQVEAKGTFIIRDKDGNIKSEAEFGTHINPRKENAIS